ncbi:hypothetical protein BHM03_00031445 [Ensete ventricosum]|nr:hypothetical protein BHM03_00031445 [Ensete ventricosum]
MVLVSKAPPTRLPPTTAIAPHKKTPVAVAPGKVALPKVLHGEGSSRCQDKVVSRPRSMCYLCHVQAQSRHQSFLAQEMADLVGGPVGLTDSQESNHHHFSMGLIDQVHDSRRVVDKLSKIIDGLQAMVQKLKEEKGLVAVVTTEAQVNEVT